MSIEDLAAHSAFKPKALPPGLATTALDVPREFLEKLPLGIYACDAEGRLLWFNRRATAIWGRTPRPGDNGEKYCGSYKVHFAGREVARDQSPMARVLRTGTPIQGLQGRFERPDGSSVWATVHIEPVKDEDGTVLGAINCFHETTTERLASDNLSRRAEGQTALYEFTERLQRAASADEIYDLALAAILRGLGCQRAAILMFDQANVMQFVAWRGLSESYRRAVSGHSPWSRDSKRPDPVLVDNVAQADLPEPLKQTIVTEGIGALAFFPLEEGGRLIGKFMAYYDGPHGFTNADTEVAIIIARQLAVSLERLRAQHAMLRLVAIVESSDDAIISKDLNGVIMTWNRGAQRIFGYSAEEVIGKPVTILMPPDRVDEEPGILARLRRGERIDHYETVRQRKDGTRLDISLTVSPLKDHTGRVIGASKIARDITDRKRAEAELRESERRLQDLLAAIPAAIYTTDAAGKITYFNEAAVTMAGRRPVIGTDEWCVTWKLYNPDGTPLPHDQCPMAVALKRGEAVRGVEAVAERPDGTRVPFIPYPTPLRDSSGRIVGAINMLVDISERKQAETQQQILLRELNHRVKNNMQLLQSMLYAAMRGTKSAEARRILDEATGRLSAMAAAHKVLYGTTNAAWFDIGEFLASVCEAAQNTMPPNVRVVAEPSSGQLPNDCATPLALIVNELVTNAAKHGLDAHGEGINKEGIIRVGLKKNDSNGFLLYVEDDGPGFDLQEVRHRSSGLQLVQGLARQLRGRFEVTRTPATRCCVHFAQ